MSSDDLTHEWRTVEVPKTKDIYHQTLWQAQMTDAVNTIGELLVHVHRCMDETKEAVASLERRRFMKLPQIIRFGIVFKTPIALASGLIAIGWMRLVNGIPVYEQWHMLSVMVSKW